MSGFKLILSRDTRDLAGTTAFRVIVVVLMVLAIAFAAGAGASVIASPAGESGPISSAPSAAASVGMMLYFATLMPFLVLLWVFSGAILTKEKASGHLEALLATPLSPRTLWLAKSMTMVLPALAIAALSSALILTASAVAARAQPVATAFSIPAPNLVACLVGNPLLFSALGALTVVIAFKASPDASIVPSFILGFGLMILVPVGAGLRIIDPASWALAGAYLGAGVLLWILVFILERGLTKEMVVLSSRED